MNKIYAQAPLPFQGQKRRFLKPFKEALKANYSKNYIFIDLFGGSGLLSQWCRECFQNATIVYNDFDNYSQRVANTERTNVLLNIIRDLVKDCAQDKLIPKPIKESILKIIKTEEMASGFVDYITLSSSLLFSMKYVTNYDQLAKETMYNVVRKNNYENAADYLQGVDIVHQDYRELFNRWKHLDNVVFLVDPPYLSTDCSTYSSYWRLSNYLDVLQTLQGTNYFYFTSNKSSLLELTDWMERNMNAKNPFSGANKVEMNVRMNHNSGYVDIMLWKKKCSL
ncbi:MAG: DNA adenine methylase [Paludibacter sp.]|nr:DNA adenine methylase [Paludibacter sp.]